MFNKKSSIIIGTDIPAMIVELQEVAMKLHARNDELIKALKVAGVLHNYTGSLRNAIIATTTVVESDTKVKSLERYLKVNYSDQPIGYREMLDV